MKLIYAMPIEVSFFCDSQNDILPVATLQSDPPCLGSMADSFPSNVLTNNNSFAGMIFLLQIGKSM